MLELPSLNAHLPPSPHAQSPTDSHPATTPGRATPGGGGGAGGGGPAATVLGPAALLVDGASRLALTTYAVSSLAALFQELLPLPRVAAARAAADLAPSTSEFGLG